MFSTLQEIGNKMISQGVGIISSKQFPSQIHKIHNLANLISQGVRVLCNFASSVHHYCASSTVSFLKQMRPSTFSASQTKKTKQAVSMWVKENEFKVWCSGDV